MSGPGVLTWPTRDRAGSRRAVGVTSAVAIIALVGGCSSGNGADLHQQALDRSGAGTSSAVSPTKFTGSPTHRYTYTGSVSDPLVVPAGVTSVSIDISGASGGQTTTACVGGLGARVTGTLPVHPGDSLVVAVGGEGKDANGKKAPGDGGWSSPAAFSGGGGGHSHGALDYDGAGGGGATTIAVNGTVQVVASGAGGAGGSAIATCYTGGNGGNDGGGDNGKGGSLGGVGGSAAHPANNKNGGDSSSTALKSGGGGGGGGHWPGAGGQAAVDGGGGGGGSSLATLLSAPSIFAAERGDGSATLSYTGTSAPTISGTPPEGQIDKPYSFAFSTTGEPAPTVTQNQGDLPDGLTIDDKGLISGTPTTAGTFNFTVTASNTVRDTNPLHATITIGAVGSVIASPNPQTFQYSGAVDTVIVPVGVTRAQVELDGAAGGGGGGSAANQPGTGVHVTGTLDVTPGDTLEVGVGGQGQANQGNQTPGRGGWGSAAKYSGGDGGSGHGAFDSDASGGGGATTLAVNGTVEVVAAGAGGASSSTLNDYGWAGGSGGGESGGHAGGSSISDSGGGKGGAPGTSYDNDRNGLSGNNPSAGGGGGGGGYYPGQGGRSSAFGEGGGGGASLTHNLAAASATANPTATTGSAKITWLGSPPTISGQPPAATVGTPVNFTFTTTEAPNVAVTSGTLPSGLSLSRSGRLTGTPKAAGTAQITVTATNYFGSAPLTCTMTVK